VKRSEEGQIKIHNSTPLEVYTREGGGEIKERI